MSICTTFHHQPLRVQIKKTDPTLADLLCSGNQFGLEGLLCFLFILHLLLQMINIAGQGLGFVVSSNLLTGFFGQLFLWEEREEERKEGSYKSNNSQ